MSELRDLLAKADDLGAWADALSRETAIRQVMEETGEPREVVEEAVGAMDAMAEEGVLDLAEGNPTTLRDGLARYVEVLADRDEVLARDWVLSDLYALLNYPWAAERPGVPVDPEDSLERQEGEPVGYHRRRTTETGYPLMGSSDAEREEAHQRTIRIQRQAMRDHVFVGDGRYCEAMLPMGSSGGEETGIITMTAGCGYGRDTHPEAV